VICKPFSFGQVSAFDPVFPAFSGCFQREFGKILGKFGVYGVGCRRSMSGNHRSHNSQLKSFGFIDKQEIYKYMFSVLFSANSHRKR